MGEDVKFSIIEAIARVPRFVEAPRTVQVIGFLRFRELTNWKPRGAGWGMICRFD